MRLVERATGVEIVAFDPDKKPISFINKPMEDKFWADGIKIPSSERKGDFSNRKVVLLDDPLFYKAFKEIYCTYKFPSSSYKWED